jgi:hypothetical protein
MNEEVKKPAEWPRSAVIIPFPRNRIKRVIIPDQPTADTRRADPKGAA